MAVSRLDDRSRNPLHARAFATVTMDDVEAAFLQACAEHGIPARTLTDNGTAYTTRPVSATPGRFERTLALMGVRQSNGRPCHPPDAGQDRTLPPHPEAMALRPSPGVLDRRAQRTARRIPARLQRGAAAPRARPTNPGEACRAEGKALPDPELAAGTQTKLDEQRRRETTACSPGATRRKPIPKDERAEPARADVTIGPGIRRIDRRGCVTQNNIAGKRRIFNLGKHNAGRMAELLIDHGRAVATDLETGEILADQTLDATREYQYRKPANDVNDAPRQM